MTTLKKAPIGHAAGVGIKLPAAHSPESFVASTAGWPADRHHEQAKTHTELAKRSKGSIARYHGAMARAHYASAKGERDQVMSHIKAAANHYTPNQAPAAKAVDGEAGTLGVTSSGKPIKYLHTGNFHTETKGWTERDHDDAKIAHTMAKSAAFRKAPEGWASNASIRSKVSRTRGYHRRMVAHHEAMLGDPSTDNVKTHLDSSLHVDDARAAEAADHHARNHARNQSPAAKAMDAITSAAASATDGASIAMLQDLAIRVLRASDESAKSVEWEPGRLPPPLSDARQADLDAKNRARRAPHEARARQVRPLAEDASKRANAMSSAVDAGAANHSRAELHAAHATAEKLHEEHEDSLRMANAADPRKGRGSGDHRDHKHNLSTPINTPFDVHNQSYRSTALSPKEREEAHGIHTAKAKAAKVGSILHKVHTQLAQGHAEDMERDQGRSYSGPKSEPTKAIDMSDEAAKGGKRDNPGYVDQEHHEGLHKVLAQHAEAASKRAHAMSAGTAKSEPKGGWSSVDKHMAHDTASILHDAARFHADMAGNTEAHAHHLGQSEAHLGHADHLDAGNVSIAKGKATREEHKEIYMRHMEQGNFHAREAANSQQHKPATHEMAGRHFSWAADHAIRLAAHPAEAGMWSRNARDALNRSDHHERSARFPTRTEPTKAIDMSDEVAKGYVGDDHEHRELYLNAKNGYDFKGVMDAARRSVIRHAAAGRYDHDKAAKSFKRAVDDVSKRYGSPHLPAHSQQYPGDHRGGHHFDNKTRTAVAQKLTDEFREEAATGSHDHLSNTPLTRTHFGLNRPQESAKADVSGHYAGLAAQAEARAANTSGSASLFHGHIAAGHRANSEAAKALDGVTVDQYRSIAQHHYAEAAKAARTALKGTQ